MCRNCSNQETREPQPQQQATLPNSGLAPLVPPVAKIPSEVKETACDGCGALGANEDGIDGYVYCEECHREKFAVCVNCDRNVDRDDCITNAANQDYCDECYNETYTTCAACREEVAVDDSISPTSGRYDGACMCESCYEEKYDRCADCGEEVYNDHSYSNDEDNRICESCWENYCTCEDCGGSVASDNAIYRDGSYYCQGCAPEEEGCYAREFSPSRPTFERTASKRRFGVELETAKCAGYEALAGDTYFEAKDDGSITGMEFVSTVLSGDAGLEGIEEFCEIANRKGFTVDAKCGFHAHFDVGELSDDQLKAVACAYHATSSVWRSFVSGARRDNTYCGAIEWDFNDMAACNSFREFAGCVDRYQWLNIAAYRRHKTLEVRVHSATLNAYKVCNWVVAHIRFIDAVSKMTVEEVRAKFRGKSAADNFAAIAEIWGDSEITEFYRSRAAQFGTKYPSKQPASVGA